MDKYNKLTECRICGYTDFSIVISLGEQYIASRFPDYGDFSIPKIDIDLCICNNPQCNLLQLYQTVLPCEMYEHEYGYRSGLNNTMKNHLKQYKEEIENIVQLQDNDFILDIGSNDSTMLQCYSNKYNRIGIDPTGKQFKDFYGSVELIPTYFTKENFQKVYPTQKCKIISSISMFYDLPQPVQFAKDIYDCLHNDGIWTCEQSYLLTMIKRNSIDTICHEHLEYYSLKQIKLIADLANFKIIDIKFNDCNGGSFRIYFAKKESSKYKENTELIQTILKEEYDYGIYNQDFYPTFMNSCNHEIQKLQNFIQIINQDNKKMFIYGASTKGNTLLQYANLNEQLLPFAVERNPRKINKMTCTGIKIISEEHMRELKPEFLLVLPYHFKEEIIQREKEYLDNGGQLVFPFPTFQIYSSKPKLLITGSDGFIGSYIKENYQNYTLYGINKNIKNPEKNITKIHFDMNDKVYLENIINTIQPESIIHLASISSSQYAFHNPIETIFQNGVLTSYLCDIIHRNKLNTKLFNASSSEIFKGHVQFHPTDNETHKFHNHPYSIAKILGHSMIDFYRETYQLPFSNGIIYTNESSRKNNVFLFHKIINHIKEWRNEHKPIILGNLNSMRNIIHPFDTIQAIQTILSQPTGDNYLICNLKSHCIYDIVLQIYQKAGIDLIKKDNIFYCTQSNLPVIIIQSLPDVENTVIDIQGYPTKLIQLGWYPSFSIENIIQELISKL